MSHARVKPGSTPVTGIGVLLVAVTFCCGPAGCQKEEAKEQAPPPAEVIVVPVAQRDVPIYQEWVGTLAGEVNASISAQVSGYLTRREYQEGSPVKKDQVLFQIDPGPFNAALEIARAQLAMANAEKGKTTLDVQRYTPLAAKDAVSKQELDNAIQADKVADGQIAMAKAKVQEAELNLGFTTIRSPVDGVAGISKAQVGDLIGPNAGPLTTVLQINPIRAYFTISQQLVAELQQRLLAENKTLRRGDEGPELQLTLANGYVYPIKGKARFGDNQVDVRTGSVQVIGEFPNPDGFLVPGMFARVRALMRTDKDALLVPQRAVQQIQGRYLVAVVGADKKVSVRPVTAGERVGEDWVIRGDLKPGDRIIVEGAQKVREGVAVTPVDFKPPTTQPGTAAEASAQSP